MLSKSLQIFFSVAFLMMSFKVTAAWPDVDISLTDCSPSGLIAHSSESWNPKRFWVRQAVSLEMALETEDLSNLYFDCKLNFPDDEIERLACKLGYKNRHSAIVKCLKHSRVLCRKHGGRC
jgi:hypothetical protein